MVANPKLNILLVDDNQFILNTLYELLDSANYKHVERAKSAEEALAILNEQRFDLIITDVEMGQMNGLELLKRIRVGKVNVDKQIPVIVLTTHSEVNVLGTAIALDANGFLAKPVRIESLITKINEAVSSTLNLRPAVAYEVISSDVLKNKEEPLSIICIDDAPEELSSDISTGIMKPEYRNEKQIIPQKVHLMRLKSGMVLGKDIVAGNGSVLIKSGTELTENSISRLKELSKILLSQEIEIMIEG